MHSIIEDLADMVEIKAVFMCDCYRRVNVLVNTNTPHSSGYEGPITSILQPLIFSEIYFYVSEMGTKGRKCRNNVTFITGLARA